MADSCLGFVRARAQMGCEEDVVQIAQRARVRLLRVDVDSRARDLPGFKRVDERGFVDDVAARRVDNVNAFLHFRERLRVQHAFCFRSARHVQEMTSAFAYNSSSATFGAFGSKSRRGLVNNRAHAERARFFREERPDPAITNKPERLAAILSTGEFFLEPLLALHARVPAPTPRIKQIIKADCELRDRIARRRRSC